MEVFSKVLTETDTKARLAVPTQSLRDLPSFKGGHETFSMVHDERSERQWVFRLSKRREGPYAKPVLTGDWIDFVRYKQLEIGEKITLIKEDGQGPDARYTIQAMKKKLTLFGLDIWVSV